MQYGLVGNVLCLQISVTPFPYPEYEKGSGIFHIYSQVDFVVQLLVLVMCMGRNDSEVNNCISADSF